VSARPDPLRIRAPRGASILAPVFSLSTTKLFGFGMLALLVALAWLLPADSADCKQLCAPLQNLHDIATTVPLFNRLQHGSDRPWAIGISSFGALLMALIAAAMIDITRLEKLNCDSFQRGGIKPLLGRLCAYALWAAMFFVGPGAPDQSRGGRIVNAIQQGQVSLTLWLVIFYSASAFILIAMLVEVLARTLKGRDSHANDHR
jgi:hypothetical protein